MVTLGTCHDVAGKGVVPFEKKDSHSLSVIKVPYLPVYNVRFFLAKFASKIEMRIIHETFCFHVR